MRLIIDANALSEVFDSSNSNHKNYAPVKKCVLECKGVMYYGGTKFKEEIETQKSLIKLLGELRKSGKLIELNQDVVDKKEKALKVIEPATNFDDPHLIAICIIAEIELICSNDKRADKYITAHYLYPSPKLIPAIYRNLTHKHLLIPCF